MEGVGGMGGGLLTEHIFLGDTPIRGSRNLNELCVTGTKVLPQPNQSSMPAFLPRQSCRGIMLSNQSSQLSLFPWDDRQSPQKDVLLPCDYHHSSPKPSFPRCSRSRLEGYITAVPLPSGVLSYQRRPCPPKLSLSHLKHSVIKAVPVPVTKAFHVPSRSLSHQTYLSQSSKLSLSRLEPSVVKAVPVPVIKAVHVLSRS